MAGAPDSGLQQIRSPSLAFGLNLRDGVDAVGMGFAIDAMDVAFTERGGVKSRPGYRRVGLAEQGRSTHAPNHVESFYGSRSSVRRIVVAGGRHVQTSTPGATPSRA